MKDTKFLINFPSPVQSGHKYLLLGAKLLLNSDLNLVNTLLTVYSVVYNSNTYFLIKPNNTHFFTALLKNTQIPVLVCSQHLPVLL